MSLIKMYAYAIGTLRVESDEALPLSYNPFLIQSSDDHYSNIIIQHSYLGVHQAQGSRFVTELATFRVFQNVNDINSEWSLVATNGMCTFYTNSDYSITRYYYQTFLNDALTKAQIHEILKPYFQVILECKLTQLGYLILHAACVDVGGVAYAFTGPSGIGKSSRAQKWCELLSGKLISGDRPIIYAPQKTVYGAPWDGKEAVYRNVSRPLAAIIKVVRSETTRIVAMNGYDKQRLLFGQALIPMWDTSLATKAFRTVSLIAHTIPIIELHCNLSDTSIIQAYNLVREFVKS